MTSPSVSRSKCGGENQSGRAGLPPTWNGTPVAAPRLNSTVSRSIALPDSRSPCRRHEEHRAKKNSNSFMSRYFFLFSDKKARGDGLNVFSELHLALTSEYIQRLFHIIMLMQLDSLAKGTTSTLSSYLRSDETFSCGYSSGHDFSRPLPVCFPPKNLQKPAAIHCCPSFHKYIKSCKYRPRGNPILGG